MRLRDCIKNTAKQLSGITHIPQQEARLLVAHIVNQTTEWCIAHDDYLLSDQQQQLFVDLLKQRLQHKPLAKILGYKEFYGYRFGVTQDVLDPRPDSETLINAVKVYYPDQQQPYHILDLGTGSGCLIITLSLEYQHATGLAVDSSQPALDICQQNMRDYRLKDRLTLLKGNWFQNIAPQQFDFIISNPPYICHADIQKLDATVKNYDPHSALDGGQDGLECYRAILSKAKNYLKPNGLIFFEIGQNQANDITHIALQHGFGLKLIQPDLSGIERVMVFSHSVLQKD